MRLQFRYSHGGPSRGSARNPFLLSRASISSISSTVSPGAYFRYPSTSRFDECVLGVGAIGLQHIGKDAPVLVEAVCLKSDLIPKDQD